MLEANKTAMLAFISDGPGDINIWGPIILFSMLIAAIIVKYRLYIHVVTLFSKGLAALKKQLERFKN